MSAGKHKNRWRDSSAENRVIGDYEVEEWKDVGKLFIIRARGLHTGSTVVS